MDVRRRMLFKNNAISNEGPINIDNYLTIEAREDGLTASLSTNACEYCVDGDGNWKSLAAGTVTESINNGQTLSFRGNLTPNSSNGIGTFTISKKCNLKGNCMSMLFEDNAVNNYSLSGKTRAFHQLFYDCTNIVNVSDNFLPATTLADNCYSEMFSFCTSLTTAPKLPATTLASSCYLSMFIRCTNLTTAPELPATSLAKSCYYNMFRNCTSLTTAPELPATSLISSCYSSMFYGCTSLTTAPALPATILEDYCYYYMFCRCKKLNYIKMLATDTSGQYCLYSWVDSVASSGTFVKHPDMTTLQTGENGIPSGWTVVNDGEENGPNLITFTVGGGSKYGIEDKTYTAIEGMTFGEFVNSEYNIDGWSLSYDEYTNKTRILHQYDSNILDEGGGSVFDTNVILESEYYMWM